MALDHSQQIVELVGDAGCEATDCFHFLRLTKLALKLKTVGNVFNNHELGSTRFESDWLGPHERGPVFSVTAMQNVLLAAKASLGASRSKDFRVVLVPKFQISGRTADEFFAFVPRELEKTLVGIEETSICAVLNCHRQGTGVECLCETLFSVAQIFLNAKALIH